MRLRRIGIRREILLEEPVDNAVGAEQPGKIRQRDLAVAAALERIAVGDGLLAGGNDLIAQRHLTHVLRGRTQLQFDALREPGIEMSAEDAVERQPMHDEIGPVLQQQAGAVSVTEAGCAVQITQCADLPRDGLKDVEISVLLAEGLRQIRLSAEPAGDGVYQFTFTPPSEGIYYATVQIPSLRIRPNQLPYMMIRANAEAADAAAGAPEPSGSTRPKVQ